MPLNMKVYKCDKCKAELQDIDEARLPVGWYHLDAYRDRDIALFCLDLCDKCVVELVGTLGVKCGGTSLRSKRARKKP